MSYTVKTRYLSCAGVVSHTCACDNHDAALSFAFDCIMSNGYDEVSIYNGDTLVLNYRNPLN